jgi:subtilisin family serine protease
MRYFAIIILSFIINTEVSSQNEWLEKVSPRILLQLVEKEEVECLILLKDSPDLRQATSLKTKENKGQYVFENLHQSAKSSQQDLIQWLNLHNKTSQSLFIVNLIKTSLDESMIEAIAKRSEVKSIMHNARVKLSMPEDRPYASLREVQWGIQKINADSVWEMGITGQDAVVGGQDTGYEWDHPALKASYRGYDADRDTAFHDYNWHDAVYEINPLHNDSIPDPSNNPCGLQVNEPCDDHLHGTHTMGTMVGSTPDESIGVAPDASWCGCRNMERGWGTPFTYLECFQWFLAPTDLNNQNPDPRMAPHVINNSWSCPPVEGCDSSNIEVMNQAVRHLKLAGIVVVVSAGNEGGDCNTISSPAAIYDESFTVGATNEQDSIAGFSSRGPVLVDGSGRLKPNVVAPGVRIRSSLLNGTYGNLRGTSMAGPHVAGVVALMISANPALSGQVDTITAIIQRTAIPLITEQECDSIAGNVIPNYTYGYGRIDALAAVREALARSSSMVSDRVEYFADIYPNPVKDRLYIDIRGGIAPVSFTLLHPTGQQVMFHTIMTSGRILQDVDVSLLPPGIYYYRIMAGKSFQSGKLIKL